MLCWGDKFKKTACSLFSFPEQIPTKYSKNIDKSEKLDYNAGIEYRLSFQTLNAKIRKGKYMLIAHGSKNERVLAKDADKTQQYFCPICNKPVILKAASSKAVQPHFAHKTKCIDGWSHDMSEWHLNWQNHFPKECQEIVMEKDGIKHRADVCVGNTVIEFQYSPLSSDEFMERNIFYTSCGYCVVWVFYAEGKLKNDMLESTEFLDPARCSPGDLCWKRKNKTFSQGITPNVMIYLQYQTSICPIDKRFKNKVADILLPISEMSEKRFTFYKTAFYIMPQNFLKQYNACNLDNIYSITELSQKTSQFLRKNRLKY